MTHPHPELPELPGLPDEHVLRVAGDGALVDWPAIGVPVGRYGARWAATTWPEPLNPGGWATVCWAPAPRGWYVPAHVLEGAVIQFGAWWCVGASPHPQRACWYGWVRDLRPGALVVIGPYPHPDAAVDDGAVVADRLRRSVAHPPSLALAVELTDE